MADDRPILDPDELSPHDLHRAKAVVPDGLSPWEMLRDPEQVISLTMWGLLSRDNPDLTWDEAIRTPFSAFRKASDDGPPPTPPPASSGSRRSRSGALSSRTKPTGSPPAPPFVATTASDEASTTP